MTAFDPCRSIVRILHPDNSVEGVGFLITKRKVLTCAHVYNQVVQNETVNLDFPLLERQKPVQARLVALYQVNPDPGPGELEDIALLEISHEVVLPSDAAPMPRSSENEAELAGRRVEIYGFPHDMARDHWVRATLRRRSTDGRIQLDPETGIHTVVRGYSGAPVWDGQTGAAVGMIVEVNLGRDGQVIAAYMISSETLASFWPESDSMKIELQKPQPHADPKSLVRP